MRLRIKNVSLMSLFFFLPLQNNGSLMWCQNHKQCSKVRWPSPLSLLVNEMHTSFSDDGAQVETGRARQRSRNGSPFSDVDTASSEEARSHVLLPTRRYDARSSKILKELKSRRQFVTW